MSQYSWDDDNDEGQYGSQHQQQQHQQQSQQGSAYPDGSMVDDENDFDFGA